MIRPPYLKAGDKVGIVSTAKRTAPEEIAKGLELLTSWQLQPVPGEHVYSTHGFFAGTDEERRADLQQMLDDESIKAIFFTKGAYGTMRIINDIDFSGFMANPKWVAGYSDITALHHHINGLDIETIHSVMLQGMNAANEATIETLRAALFGEQLSYTIPADTHNKNPKAVSGELAGGNLSMLYAIMDSEAQDDVRDRILFIEDIDEYLYHYDRMLQALRNRGKLTRLKAILVGEMIDIKESTIPFGQTHREILLHHTKDFGYPIIFSFPAGHSTDNRALIMGRNVSITPEGDAVTIQFTDDAT
jgi:muramoyltetrapeptide carboxypeptidase